MEIEKAEAKEEGNVFEEKNVKCIRCMVSCSLLLRGYWLLSLKLQPERGLCPLVRRFELSLKNFFTIPILDISPKFVKR